MIPKIATSIPTTPCLPERSPSAFDAVSPASFQKVLLQVQDDNHPLEGPFLDFLIKTIESIIRALSWEKNEFPTPLFMSSYGSYGGALAAGGPNASASPPEAEKAVINPLKGQDFDGIVQEAAERYGVDPALIKAVIAVESNGNPRAVSPAGAMGLMQLMPKTAEELGVKDPFDPRENIMAGTRYLKRLLDRYQGNRSLALAAYNWGMGNLEKNPHLLPRETRNYLVRVEEKLQAYLNRPTSV